MKVGAATFPIAVLPGVAQHQGLHFWVQRFGLRWQLCAPPRTGCLVLNVLRQCGKLQT